MRGCRSQGINQFFRSPQHIPVTTQIDLDAKRIGVAKPADSQTNPELPPPTNFSPIPPSVPISNHQKLQRGGVLK